ncbi:MAG TPA: ABC transporter permease subunit [Longilinea sp.]|nr:ABC transporter permease subunit [Longilinea sp.]
MSATIFKHEFLMRLKSVIIWSISISALMFLFFSIYPGFAADTADLNQLMENFPPELRAAFGLNTMDLSSVVGYFGFLFIFVQVCLAVQASNYGFGLVSIEENELTADFLLTKPVSRAQVITSKFLAALTSLTVTNAVLWGITFLSIEMFREGRTYDAATVVLVLSSVILFQLFYFCVGLVVSLLVKRVRSVTPYSLGLAFGTYVLSAFSGIFEDVKLELITPFKHFDPAYMIQNGSYDTSLVLLNVAITLISLAVSYWLYTRRDIPAVS